MFLKIKVLWVWFFSENFQCREFLPTETSLFHDGIIESFSLEQTFKIIQSNS